MADNNHIPRTDNQKASNVISLNRGGGINEPVGPFIPKEIEGETGDLPSGFLLREDGIYQLRPSSEGDEIPLHLCSPITVIGLCSRLDGSCWGRVVDVLDPDGKMHRLIIDETEFSGSPARLLRPLLDTGLVVEPVEKAVQSIATLLQSWRPNIRFTRADQLGWTDDSFKAFALGDGQVIGDENVVFAYPTNDTTKAMHARGSLEDWRKSVAAPCVGNPLMIFSVSLAFSGPLLWPLSIDGGGFHLRGSSSHGKSTLMDVAVSVWGAPSFRQSWRTTDNGLEGVASACSGALLALDELHMVSPRIVGESVYMLANGCGKSRMQSNGRAQPINRWHVPVLSNGEISLEEHMASGGKQMQAGQDIRLLDITADARSFGVFDCLHATSDGHIFAEQMNGSVKASYGTAGPTFVKKLMRNLEHRNALQSFINRFCDEVRIELDIPNDGQVLRALRRFAVTALAGEMATKFLVTGWAPGIAKAAAKEIFRTWFEERDGSTRSEIDSSVAKTRDYLVKNGHQFVAIDNSGLPAISGWHDDLWFYILPDTWKVIHGESDPIEAARHHRSSGLLKTQKGNSLQYRMGRKMPGRPKVYAVKYSIIEGD